MEDSQTGWMERRGSALSDPSQRPYSDLASQSWVSSYFLTLILSFLKLFSLLFFCLLSWEYGNREINLLLLLCVLLILLSLLTMNYLWASLQTLQGPTSAHAPKTSGTVLMRLVIIAETLDVTASLAFFTAFLQCHPESWPTPSKDRIPQSPFSTWPEQLWRNN